MTPSWLVRNRVLLWRIGVEHREALMMQYMVLYGLTQRPFLKNVYRELIGEIQEARILDAPLPMDRFAQTEVVNGRPEITINTLIGRMPLVKDPGPIKHVAAWHESIHIPADVERREIPPLTDLRSGLEGETSSPLLCRASPGSLHRWSLREQAIEAAALAASIADADLRRCVNYLNFLQLAAMGGDMGVHRLAFAQLDFGRHRRRHHGSPSVFRAARDLSLRRGRLQAPADRYSTTVQGVRMPGARIGITQVDRLADTVRD